MCTVEGQINFNQFETHFGITFVGWNFPFHPIKPECSLYMGVDKDLLNIILGIYAYLAWAHGTCPRYSLMPSRGACSYSCGIIRESQGKGP